MKSQCATAMQPVKVLRLATVLAVLGLALTSCTEADASSDASTSTAVPTKSASAAGPTAGPSSATAHRSPDPRPTAASADGPARNVPVPEMPVLAGEESQEGLEAFANYWFELVSYAYESGDTAPVAALSGEECGTCENVFRSVEEGNSGNKWIEGGGMSVGGFETDFEPFIYDGEPNTYQIYLMLSQDETRSYEDGAVSTTTVKNESIENIMFAVYNAEGWSIANIGPPGEGK